jgi:hypothetical protein
MLSLQSHRPEAEVEEEARENRHKHPYGQACTLCECSERNVMSGTVCTERLLEVSALER